LQWLWHHHYLYFEDYQIQTLIYFPRCGWSQSCNISSFKFDDGWISKYAFKFSSVMFLTLLLMRTDWWISLSPF
jgi:hypothetical protein